MKQTTVLAITWPINASHFEEILEDDALNRMGTMSPEPMNVERAASLPVDAIVMYSPRLTEMECAFFDQLYMLRGRVTLALVSDEISADILTRAMACGATKVISSLKPASEVRASIIAEVERTKTRRGSVKVTKHESRTLGFFGTKGGCGKTTLAVNTAVALAKSGKAVAILDLDLQFGDVGVFMDLPRCETISELVQEPYLNSSTVGSYLCSHSSGVKVLCAPPSPELAETVTPEHIEQIVTTLRNEFDYLLFDLPPALDDCSLTALELADKVYFVANPEIPTLKNTRICMGVMRSLGVEGKVHLVLNRDGDPFVSRRDVERTLEMPVELCVPVDAKASSAAINRGIPVVISSPRSKMSRAISSFAAKGDI